MDSRTSLMTWSAGINSRVINLNLVDYDLSRTCFALSVSLWATFVILGRKTVAAFPGCLMLQWLIITCFHHTTKLLGVGVGVGYWFHPVRPSVRPSVRPTFRVCSVAPRVLVGSISYLYILSSKIRRCVVCTYIFANLKIGFLAIFLRFVILTLSSFDLWSDVNH